MRVAAFDIGTRNLSFAILELDPDNKRFKILEWENIDLVLLAQKKECLEQTYGNGKCSVLTKTKKECSSKNVVTVTRPLVAKKLSSMTLAALNLRFPDLVTAESHNKKDIVNSLMTDTPESAAYCSRHFPTSKLPFEYADLKGDIQKADSKKRTKITDIHITAAMISALDQYPLLLEIDTILIEMQMRKDMICIAAQIKGWFITRRLVDSTASETSLQIIDMPAIKKLCMYSGPEIKCSLKGIHPRNKFYGIAHARSFLQDYPEYLQVLEKSKKKDDLSDTLLMCLYHLYVVYLKTIPHIPFVDPTRHTSNRIRKSVFSKYNKKTKNK